MNTSPETWEDPTPYVAANGNRFNKEQAKMITEPLAYRPRTEPGRATTVQDLDDAPRGYIAVDRNLLVYTKPFHASNMWRLGGFTELIPADTISLPARLYRITPDGHIVQPESENTTS